MAITLASLALSSGLELLNPLLVISELNVSNNTSASEHLDIINAPGEGVDVNQAYKVINTRHGGRGCSVIVSVFMSQAAFDAGKPPIDVLKDGRNTKVFSINLDAPEFEAMTPRQAAYAYLLSQEFSDGELVTELEV